MLKRMSLLVPLFALLTFPLFAEKKLVDLDPTIILVHLDRNINEIDKAELDQGTTRCFYCRRALNPKNTCEYPTNSLA